MKKNRFIMGILTTLVMAGLLTACSSTQASEADAETATQTDTSFIYGQISAVDETSLTIEVGEMNEPDGDRGPDAAGDENATPPDSESVDATSHATETDSSQTPPEAPEGSTEDEAGPHGGGGMYQITLTGETQTLTITDATTIISMAANPNESSSSEASVADLAVGTTVKITLGSDDAISSIEIMGGGQPAEVMTTSES